MKKEIAPGFLWHLDEVALLFQVTIVTTVDNAGRINAAPFGLVMPFCSNPENPQMLLCCNRMWHTSQNIEATGEFVINYAPYHSMKQVACTGCMYPEGTNEIEKAGLTPLAAVTVRPPRIQECFQHFECRLSRIIQPSDTQNNIIGDIVSISINEELAGINQQEKLTTADPLILFGMDISTQLGNYAGTGRPTAYAPPAPEDD